MKRLSQSAFPSIRFNPDTLAQSDISLGAGPHQRGHIWSTSLGNRDGFRFSVQAQDPPVWYKDSVNNNLRHHEGPCGTPDTISQTVLFPDLFDKPLVARRSAAQLSRLEPDGNWRAPR